MLKASRDVQGNCVSEILEVWGGCVEGGGEVEGMGLDGVVWWVEWEISRTRREGYIREKRPPCRSEAMGSRVICAVVGVRCVHRRARV